MKILYGLSDGALLQRDGDGFCDCTFAVEAAGALGCDKGQLTKIEDGVYRLTGIPAGGPYTVTLSDDDGSVTLNLWVGDLWLLGGQSNMEGAGRYTSVEEWEHTHPDPAVRAYYSDDRWDGAVPLLHTPWSSVDACQKEVWANNQKNSQWASDKPAFESHGVTKQGVGPGIYFARKMQEITGVPQAVIPCALGGSGMGQWNPDGADNLYTAMIARVKRTGGKVRGLFWYQGCSETYPDGVKNFQATMARFVEALRRDCHDPALPFVQVQIAKNNLHWNSTVESGRLWEGIREAQRTLDSVIPHMDTIAAIDMEMEDLIHLSTSAHKILGVRAALSMAHLCGWDGAPAPRLAAMEIGVDECVPFRARLALRFENVTELTSVGPASGFTITADPEELVLMPSIGIARIRLAGDTVYVYTEVTQEELKGKYVRYGYLNMGNCTIVDKNGHGLPAFGPLAIADWVQ